MGTVVSLYIYIVIPISTIKYIYIHIHSIIISYKLGRFQKNSNGKIQGTSACKLHIKVLQVPAMDDPIGIQMLRRLLERSGEGDKQLLSHYTF